MRRRLSSIPIDSILHSFSKKRSELDDVQRADWAPLLIVIAPFSSGAEDFLDTLREHVELSSPLDLKSPNHFVSVPIETAFSRWNGNLSKEERERMSADVVHKHSLYDRLNPTECTELMLLTQYFSDPKPGGISQFQNRLMNDKNATVEDMYYREQLWQGFTALLSNTKKEDTQMMTNEVKLYIPEAKDHCMSESMNHIKESLKHKEQIIVWNYPPLGGINARWDGYKELMGMAYKYRRVVRFVRWGQELQELPFMQLVQQNIWTFLKTGRYIPLKHLHESMRAAQKLLGVRGTTLTHVECAELAGFTMDGTGRVVPKGAKGSTSTKLSDPQYRWVGWTNETIVHPLFQNFIAEKAQKRYIRRNTYSEVRSEDMVELTFAEAEKVERKIERDRERRVSIAAMRIMDDIVHQSQSSEYDADEDSSIAVSHTPFLHTLASSHYVEPSGEMPKQHIPTKSLASLFPSLETKSNDVDEVRSVNEAILSVEEKIEYSQTGSTEECENSTSVDIAERPRMITSTLQQEDSNVVTDSFPISSETIDTLAWSHDGEMEEKNGILCSPVMMQDTMTNCSGEETSPVVKSSNIAAGLVIPTIKRTPLQLDIDDEDSDQTYAEELKLSRIVHDQHIGEDSSITTLNISSASPVVQRQERHIREKSAELGDFSAVYEDSVDHVIPSTASPLFKQKKKKKKHDVSNGTPEAVKKEKKSKRKSVKNKKDGNGLHADSGTSAVSYETTTHSEEHPKKCAYQNNEVLPSTISECVEDGIQQENNCVNCVETVTSDDNQKLNDAEKLYYADENADALIRSLDEQIDGTLSTATLACVANPVMRNGFRVDSRPKKDDVNIDVQVGTEQYHERTKESFPSRTDDQSTLKTFVDDKYEGCQAKNPPSRESKVGSIARFFESRTAASSQSQDLKEKKNSRSGEKSTMKTEEVKGSKRPVINNERDNNKCEEKSAQVDGASTAESQLLESVAPSTVSPQKLSLLQHSDLLEKKFDESSAQLEETPSQPNEFSKSTELKHQFDQEELHPREQLPPCGQGKEQPQHRLQQQLAEGTPLEQIEKEPQSMQQVPQTQQEPESQRTQGDSHPKYKQSLQPQEQLQNNSNLRPLEKARLWKIDKQRREEEIHRQQSLNPETKITEISGIDPIFSKKLADRLNRLREEQKQSESEQTTKSFHKSPSQKPQPSPYLQHLPQYVSTPAGIGYFRYAAAPNILHPVYSQFPAQNSPVVPHFIHNPAQPFQYFSPLHSPYGSGFYNQQQFNFNQGMQPPPPQEVDNHHQDQNFSRINLSTSTTRGQHTQGHNKNSSRKTVKQDRVINIVDEDVSDEDISVCVSQISMSAPPSVLEPRTCEELDEPSMGPLCCLFW